MAQDKLEPLKQAFCPSLWSGWSLHVHTASSCSSHNPFGNTTKVWNLLGIMTHSYNPSAWEEEAGELEAEGLPGLDELLS